MKPGRGEGRVLVLSLYCTPPQRRYLVQFIHQVGAVHPVRWELRPAPGTTPPGIDPRMRRVLPGNREGPVPCSAPSCSVREAGRALAFTTMSTLPPSLTQPGEQAGRHPQKETLQRECGNNSIFSPLLDTLASLLLAFVLGSLVGLERQYRQRTAGLRTNVLVAGAALFVNLAQRIYDLHGGSYGVVHVVAYIVSGIGFSALASSCASPATSGASTQRPPCGRGWSGLPAAPGSP